MANSPFDGKCSYFAQMRRFFSRNGCRCVKYGHLAEIVHIIGPCQDKLTKQSQYTLSVLRAVEICSEIAVFTVFASAKLYDGTARRQKPSALKVNKGQNIICPLKYSLVAQTLNIICAVKTVIYEHISLKNSTCSLSLPRTKAT